MFKEGDLVKVKSSGYRGRIKMVDNSDVYNIYMVEMVDNINIAEFSEDELEMDISQIRENKIRDLLDD